MTYGPSSTPSGAHDYQLGQRLGGLIAQQAASKLPFSAVYSQLQDLLGADTSMLGPLRDLLGKPAFGQLVGPNQRSVVVGARDALLQELANTYNALMVSRLAAVIDGCLGLPQGPVPVQSYAPPPPAPPSYPAPPPYAAPQSYPVQPTPIQILTSPSSGARPMTAVLILLVCLLGGALLLGLGWLFLSNRPLGSVSSGKAVAPPPSSTASSQLAPAPPPSTPAPPATEKGVAARTPEPSSGAWGDTTDYKFGQLPGGDYPNSCAFSKTDENGRTTIDKSDLDYWACRDQGGDSENGYKVVWADGKETTYTFQQGGDGQVVGTNGNTYPMTWRNDSHAGDPIIVINHQDGAVSWIPGNIR